MDKLEVKSRKTFALLATEVTRNLLQYVLVLDINGYTLSELVEQHN